MWWLTGCGNKPAIPQAGICSFGWMRNRSFGLLPRLLPLRLSRLRHPWNRERASFTRLPACRLGRAGRTHQRPSRSSAGNDPRPLIAGTIQRFAGGWADPCYARLGSAFQQAPSWGGAERRRAGRGTDRFPRRAIGDEESSPRGGLSPQLVTCGGQAIWYLSGVDTILLCSRLQCVKEAGTQFRLFCCTEPFAGEVRS